jgi:flagellar hook-associated protein 2
MGTITSGVGLISGINTGQIISELISLDSQPVTLLQTRIAATNAQQTAYSALSSQLQTMQTTGKSLEQVSTFQAATATSSDQNVLTATAQNGAALGTYNLQVAQLVSTQQLISQGFTDFNQTPVGAGTISIELGGGSLSTQTTLAQLNGGQGVPTGQFRITDRSGASEVIDTSSDVTVDDVLKQINTSLGISVQASVKNNQLVLTDTTGKTTGNLTVQDLGSGTTAAALGIAGTSATNTLTGTDVNYVTSGTYLNQLNDGRGVQLGSGGNDFTVTLKNGSTVSVNLATAKTLGDVINAINTAGGGKLTATIPPNGSRIQLTDSTGGGGTLSIADNNGSHAAEDLGLTAAPTGNVINGSSLLAGIDSTLISSLRGGSGLSLGTVNFTDRSGNTSAVNFSGATDVQDIIDDINNATGAQLKASLKPSGNGIQITDASGGTGNLVIADAGGGQTATQLGIAGTFSSSTPTVSGADLQKQWLTNSTLLSTLDGGQGIAKGKITITNAAGTSSTVDLSGSTITTVGSVISQINNAGLAGVTASINSSGNGILLTDTSTGPGHLKVVDVDSTTAADLNLASTATANTIDGAYEKTITVGPNDTLSSVQKAINDLGWGVSAQIINDGSATAPYRLSLTAQNSGTAGGVVFDSGTTNLGTYNLVNAQDAAVFLGSSSTGQPLLVTSSSNQISGVIQGVTLNLNGVSQGPVQLNVTNDPSGVVQELTTFTSTFNNLVNSMNTLTSYNTTTNQAGLLLGDATTQTIEENIYNMLNVVVNTGGKYTTLADIGLSLGNGALLQFDQNTFEQALSADPTAVEQLFTATKQVTDPTTGAVTTQQLGAGYSIDNQINDLLDPVSGVITQENQALSQEVQNFQDQITDLNTNIDNQRNLLQEQFNNMEQVLAGLQSQQQELGSLTNISAPASSSSSSSSSTTKTA